MENPIAETSSIISLIECINDKGWNKSEANQPLNTTSFVCFNNRSYSNRRGKIPIIFPSHQQLLLEFCMCISAICLIIHLLVYSIVPKLRNLPGKCLMSLSLALLLASISFIASFHIEPFPHSVTCISIGLMRHYSFLAAFFWMNIMAFDVYRTFTRPAARRIASTYFFKYSLYAWLFPAAIVMLSLAVQSSIEFNSIFNPAYGYTVCGVSHMEAMLLFFMLPVGIILSINALLFILTAKSLKAAVNETKFASESNMRDQFFWHIKLVLILGLTWILGLIVMFIDIPYLRYPCVIMQGLHGMFIFVAFTCKRKVYRLIVHRINYLKSDRRFRGTKTKSTSRSYSFGSRNNGLYNSTGV